MRNLAQDARERQRRRSHRTHQRRRIHVAYLNKLPLDILKIEQSFVRNIGEDKSSEAIVASIITMAHLLEFELVAEGVETEAQLQFLRERGCQTYQGYLFGRPMPLKELEAFLTKRSKIF